MFFWVGVHNKCFTRALREPNSILLCKRLWSRALLHVGKDTTVQSYSTEINPKLIYNRVNVTRTLRPILPSLPYAHSYTLFLAKMSDSFPCRKTVYLWMWRQSWNDRLGGNECRSPPNVSECTENPEGCKQSERKYPGCWHVKDPLVCS